MGKHLKTQVIEGLKSAGFVFEALPKGSTPHKRGVHYCRIFAGAKCVVGAMDYEKEGQKYKKRIVVRLARFRDGLFELYVPFSEALVRGMLGKQGDHQGGAAACACAGERLYTGRFGMAGSVFDALFPSF